MVCSTHRVYHGTPRAFDRLEESQTGGRFEAVNVPREGIWFTTDFEEAKWYATHPEVTSHSRVIVADVTLCRPFITDPELYADQGVSEAVPELYFLKRDGYDGVIVLRAEWAVTRGNRVLPVQHWRLASEPPHIAVFNPAQVQLVTEVPASIWRVA